MAYNRANKKVAQMMPPAPPVADPTMMGGDPSMPPMDGMGGMPPVDPSMPEPAAGAGGPPFTLASLIEFIDANPDSAMDTLRSKSSETQMAAPDGSATDVDTLFEAENWRHATDEQKGMVAGKIMESLPRDMKVEENMETDQTTQVPASMQSVDIQASVRAAEALIKQQAIKIAQALNGRQTKTAYNRAMKKQAEGLPTETYHLYPEDDQKTTIDHRTQQPITTRDVVERNKGFGLRPNDFFSVNGIDFDTFWQTYLMDRYYEPTLDKDGRYVGGYIADRFEVDRNVPDMNNMQLKPGHRSKPPLATLTEGQLEKNRDSTGYNYAEAKANKAVKVACATHKCKLCGLGNPTPKYAQCDDCRKFTGSQEPADQKKK